MFIHDIIHDITAVTKYFKLFIKFFTQFKLCLTDVIHKVVENYYIQ